MGICSTTRPQERTQREKAGSRRMAIDLRLTPRHPQKSKCGDQHGLDQLRGAEFLVKMILGRAKVSVYYRSV